MSEQDNVTVVGDVPDFGIPEHEPHPRGTFVVMLIFIAVQIAFWGYMYSLLF